VKSLADEAGRATEQIAGTITIMHNAVETAVGNMKDVRQTLAQLGSFSTTVLSALEEHHKAVRALVNQMESTTVAMLDNVASITEKTDAHVATASSLADDVYASLAQIESEGEMLRGVLMGAVHNAMTEGGVATLVSQAVALEATIATSRGAHDGTLTELSASTATFTSAGPLALKMGDAVRLTLVTSRFDEEAHVTAVDSDTVHLRFAKMCDVAKIIDGHLRRAA
jgi:hypothetical protein